MNSRIQVKLNDLIFDELKSERNKELNECFDSCD